MSQYLLGIDAGNTMVKAVLFTVDGNQVAVSSSPGRTYRPHPGHVERDISELTAGLRHAIAECLNMAGIDAKDICGVGAAGHGNGLYMLDRDGRPLKGIQSIDTRGTTIVDSMNRARQTAHEMSLQKVWAAQTPVLLRWMKEHEPDLLAQAGALLLCKDVIVNYLTGVICTDISDASIAGLIRFPERRYDADLLAIYGIGDLLEKLPPVRETCDIVGHVTEAAARETGLAAGTPVVAGMIDIVASALGSGVSRVGEASVVVGTWSINQIIVDRPKLDDLVFMTTPFGRDRYMVVEASPTSAANLEWFLRTFGVYDDEPGDPAAACSKAVASVTPTTGLPLYHPYLYGSAFDGNARGGFYNLTEWHTRADVLYALFEGVTFGHRHHLDTLRAAGAQVDEAVLSGGGARSEIWPQMFADILGIPITTSHCTETGALGACVAAAVGLELFHSLRAATDAMATRAHHFEPGRFDATVLNARYAAFRNLAETMAPAWAASARS
ncbi:FGGY-family carbohydrate kinase [Thalassospira sp. TSL5-1]|uniref:FGGY-family carbohydrate kinase n=1 Tax=Thalassospira sp. TSL5-1 TaxID=1544451 RepID=UPI00093F2839|nr:FGGY-family carbohydrate kinase [Thalassospira sp. TSL5-1]OKH86282.1 xylulose kinase [Thalassospira sp. TSL5-1]